MWTEPEGGNRAMEHRHHWMVFNTADEGWLLVRCDCGKVGAVKNPSLEEWSVAYAAAKPYAWREDEEVEVLVGWTTVWDKKRGVWVVVGE